MALSSRAQSRDLRLLFAFVHGEQPDLRRKLQLQ